MSEELKVPKLKSPFCVCTDDDSYNMIQLAKALDHISMEVAEKAGMCLNNVWMCQLMVVCMSMHFNDVSWEEIEKNIPVKMAAIKEHHKKMTELIEAEEERNKSTLQ